MTTMTKCKTCRQEYPSQERHGLRDCVAGLAAILEDHEVYLDHPGPASKPVGDMIHEEVKGGIDKWLEQSELVDEAAVRRIISEEVRDLVDTAVEDSPHLGITEERCAEMIQDHLDDDHKSEYDIRTEVARVLRDPSPKVRDAIGIRIRDEFEDWLKTNDATVIDQYLARAIDNRTLRLDQLLRDLQLEVFGYHPQ
jgi:hypothetical protein